MFQPWCSLLGYPSTLLPWTMASGEKENLCPRHAKQNGLSLKWKSRKSEESSERFPLLLNEQIRENKQFSVPANTKKSTDRALRLFKSWREQRNERSSSEEEKVPDDPLVADSLEDLCRWLYTCKRAAKGRWKGVYP